MGIVIWHRYYDMVMENYKMMYFRKENSGRTEIQWREKIDYRKKWWDGWTIHLNTTRMRLLMSFRSHRENETKRRREFCHLTINEGTIDKMVYPFQKVRVDGEWEYWNWASDPFSPRPAPLDPTEILGSESMKPETLQGVLTLPRAWWSEYGAYYFRLQFRETTQPLFWGVLRLPRWKTHVSGSTVVRSFIHQAIFLVCTLSFILPWT
jgi:hypothetical protein